MGELVLIHILSKSSAEHKGVLLFWNLYVSNLQMFILVQSIREHFPINKMYESPPDIFMAVQSF